MVHVVHKFFEFYTALYTTNLQCMNLESKIIIQFYHNVKRFETVYVKALYMYVYVCMYKYVLFSPGNYKDFRISNMNMDCK